MLNFIIFRSDKIFDPSLKINSVSSQYVEDEYGTFKYENKALISAPNASVVDGNIIEVPVLANKFFWFSKPIVMILTTQQLFFQLFTENNGKVLTTKVFKNFIYYPCVSYISSYCLYCIYFRQYCA